MPPRKKSKTAAKAVDTKSAAEAGDTGPSGTANTISHTGFMDVTVSTSTGAAVPTSSRERRPTVGRTRATRTRGGTDNDTGPVRTTTQTSKQQHSTLKRKERDGDDEQQGDKDLSGNNADAHLRPMQTNPHIAEQQPAQQPTEFRERSTACVAQRPKANNRPTNPPQPAVPQVPTGNDGSAPPAQTTIPQVPTADDGSATAAQPDQHHDIQDLAEARRILTTRDPTTDPQAVKFFRRIDRLLRAVERTEANGQDYDRTRTLLHVHLEQTERKVHEKAPAIPVQLGPIPREPRMAFPAPNDVPEQPFPWTQKYWAYQRDIQKAKAAPLPDRPNRKPFVLEGPDKKKVNHTRCKERQNLLRALQFDLMYMAYCSSLKTEKGRVNQRQNIDEEEILRKLVAAGLISNFNGDWNAISKVTNKVKVESIGKLGSKSSIFEGCQKPTQKQCRPLKADDEAKLRELAKNPQGTGRDFSRSRYDNLRGTLWYELDELEVLLKEFADEEVSRADRTRTGARLRALCELAQPLNLPGRSRPTEAKAKELLSAQILRENIANRQPQVINHSQNWVFVRQFEPARRQHRWFSMSKWLHRQPEVVYPDDLDPTFEGSFDENSDASSSSSPTPVDRPPYASQIPNAAEPYQGDAENRFPGRTPYDHPGSNDTATESSSSQPPYEVGNGMLIPPEILGVDPRGHGMPDQHGFTHTQGFTMPRQQHGGEGPAAASSSHQPLLPTKGPTGKRPAPTDLSSAPKRINLNQGISAQGTSVPAMTSAMQPSISTIPSQATTTARPQMQPPPEVPKDSRKRPPPIDPPSSRKKAFTDFRDQSTSSSSGSSENSIPFPSPMESPLAKIGAGTPMSPAFRSPRKAPPPPKEPQEEEVPGTELTMDDLFAIGFPEHFGPAKSKGGDAEPASKAVPTAVVSQANVPRPMSSNATSETPGPGKHNNVEPATKQATSTEPASQPPILRPISSHNTLEIAHDSLGLPSFGQSNSGTQSSFGNPAQTQVPSAAPPFQTPPANAPPSHSPPRITPPSTTRSSLPPLPTQSPLRNLPALPPENTADEDEDPASEDDEDPPSDDDDDDTSSSNNDEDPATHSKTVAIMRRAISNHEAQIPPEATHTRAEARILRRISAKRRGRHDNDDDDDDGEAAQAPSAAAAADGGSGSAIISVPTMLDIPDTDEDEDDEDDFDFNDSQYGKEHSNDAATEANDKHEALEHETWTRGHATGVSTRGRVSLPPEDLRPSDEEEEHEKEDLGDLEQELLRQFEAEAMSGGFRAPVARMVSEEPEAGVGDGVGGGDAVNGEGARDEGSDATSDRNDGGGDIIYRSNDLESCVDDEVTATQTPQDDTNIDYLFEEPPADADEIDWGE